MSVFEQTLLDQTGQQSRARCLRKNIDAAWKKTLSKTRVTTRTKTHYRYILYGWKAGKVGSKSHRTDFHQICPQLRQTEANNQATSNTSFHICLFSYWVTGRTIKLSSSQQTHKCNYALSGNKSTDSVVVNWCWHSTLWSESEQK